MSRDNVSIIPRNEIHILVTEADKTGRDILAMSDFFGGYVQQLAESIKTNATTSAVPNVPIANLGIIAEVIQRAEVVLQGTTQLLPDFEHLPKDVRQKLKDGVYKIGESKQVDGNLRAVIVDENGSRVKDITLREVNVDPGTLEASRSITNQLQMRQIYAKLDTIQEMQNFQIARARDNDIKVPILNARNYILRAQAENCSEAERREYLKEASKELLTSINSLYSDMHTSTQRILELTRFPIFQKKNQIQDYIGFITEDIQVVTKIVGLRMQVLDYLGGTSAAQIDMQQYQSVMRDFFNKPVRGRRYSAASLIHLNYPYTEKNRDCWLQLSRSIQPVLRLNKPVSKDHIYLVSIEEEKNGEA